MLCTIFYSLVESYQKTHSFAALTRSFSDTTQLVNKNRTRAFSIDLLFTRSIFFYALSGSELTSLITDVLFNEHSISKKTFN